jgi:uncharacterized coiled-coil DUF342 family protein
MAEVNYNETIVIPFLQRKFQELVNNNLILEVNLLVEQAKNKELLDQLNNQIETSVQEIAKRDDMISEYKGKYNQTQIEMQSKAPAIHELQRKIEELNNIANDRANTITLNRNSIREQQAIIEQLKAELNTMTIELQSLKTQPVSKKKKAQPKDDVLDGDVF